MTESRPAARFQLFEALDPATEAALTESIRRFGVLVPVVRDQAGNVIDGHHRARIADTLGVKYRVDVLTVADDDEAREIARTLNADRRQLDPEQRRAVVEHLRQQGHSFPAIAKAVGTSVGTAFADAKASEAFSPERVRGQDGKSYPAKRPTIVPAKNEKEAERAQEALVILGDDAPPRVLDVKRAERMGREIQAERRRGEPMPDTPAVDGIDLRHGDFREVLDDIEPGSVDAIICDPPYPAEFVDLFADLAETAARLLKRTGVLAALTGQSHLRAYMAHLDRHLTYRWVGAYVVQGPRNRVHGGRVGTGWKPVLLYQRHDAADVPFLLDDVFDSEGDDKRHHHWGQSESGIAAIVERLTAPGALVVDPFLGGGTTAVVCRDLGRRFIGCDTDANAVRTSQERVA